MSQSVPIARLVRHPFANSESLESAALLVGALAFVITTAVALIVFWGGDLPISGPGSVGQFAALASAVVAIVVFVAARVYLNSNAESRPELP